MKNNNIPQKQYQRSIAEKLSSARKNLGMTQKELAKAMGTSQSAIARMEAGNQNFTAQTLSKLKEILGTELLANTRGEKSIKISGGNKLQGEIEIQGAKNSMLPAIAAALLVEKGTTVIKNVPNIEDVKVMLEIARSLGADVKHNENEKTVSINAQNLSNYILPADLADKIRASILFMAPLVVRMGRAQVPSSGGCNIGERKIDFHHQGYRRMGASVECNERFAADIEAPQLEGNYLYLDTPSHTGSENLMMAACLAKGETILDNVALEPEVEDLANMLVKMGAKINGVGTRTLHIQGVPRLKAVEYEIIPDRHDFTAFAIAAAITGGEVTLHNVVEKHHMLPDAKLRQMGVDIEYFGNFAKIKGSEKIKPINVITYPYPGFPTDAQPSITALATFSIC